MHKLRPIMATAVAFVLLSILASPAAAHADTIKVFNVVYGLAGGSVTGTVTLDTTTGIFLDSNVTGTDGATSYHFTGAPNLQENDLTFIRTHFFDPAHPTAFFGVLTPGTSLIGYNGGALCSDTVYCSYQGLQYVSSIGSMNTANDPAGTASLVYAYTIAPTPEPSSLILLGTALMALTGTARKRYRTFVRHRSRGLLT